MSHVVTIRTEIRDLAAVRAACSRLDLPEPQYGATQLFSATANGWRVHLSNWRYPVICNIEQGTLHYDNYEGHWGEQRLLDAFLQAYAVEKTKLEARKQGRLAVEQLLADGAIKLTIEVDA